MFGLTLCFQWSLQSGGWAHRIAATLLTFRRDPSDDQYLAAYAVGQRRTLAEQTDEELVGWCRKRDHDAFAELVNRYKHRVYWLVRRMLGGEEDEDVAQEVFLRAYEALPGFRGDCKFSTWIYKITRNLCLAELKKRGIRGQPLSLQAETDENIHCLLLRSGSGLQDEIEQLDLSQSVRKLMGKLPVQYRTVLTLFYLNQATYEEISQIMDIPLGTVKTNIHRARLQLRELLVSDAGLASPRGSGPSVEWPSAAQRKGGGMDA
jgi:RNA polymerase sigma-70 factor (ECF subfamily)